MARLIQAGARRAVAEEEPRITYNFHRPRHGGNTLTNLRPIADYTIAASAHIPAGVLDPEQTGCAPNSAAEAGVP